MKSYVRNVECMWLSADYVFITDTVDKIVINPMKSGNHRVGKFVTFEVLLIQCRTEEKIKRVKGMEGRKETYEKENRHRWKGNEIC